MEDELRSRTAAVLARPDGDLAALIGALDRGEITAYAAASRILADPDLLAAVLGLAGPGEADV